jgi:O-antigen/teichoic acid export membrane protein
MLKRNIKMVFSTNALMLCSGVVTSLLSAWALGPEGRGDLMVVLMWPGIFAMISEFGLPTAYRFWTAKSLDNVSPLFTCAVVLTLMVGLLMWGLAWIVIPMMIGHRSPEVLYLAQIYAIVIPMALLTDLIRGLLEGARRFHWVAALRLIFFGVQAVCYVALWFMDRLTLGAAMYTMIGSALASLIVALIAVTYELRPRWQAELGPLKTALRYGIKDYPGILTEFVNWRLDLMMLVNFASSTSIGLYSIAVRLSDITTVLASSVGDALMPEVAASHNGDEATKIVTRSLRLTLAAHLLLLVPLWIAAPYILYFAYGDGFVPVTNVLRLLMIASVIWSGGAIVISGLNGLGHPGLSTIARLSAAIVMVIALFAWLPRWGIKGAALASITGYSVMFVVALFSLLRQQKVGLWECLRPRLDDIPDIMMPANLRREFLRYIRRSTAGKPRGGEALATGLD